jgi:hypothetical protein
MKMRTRTKSAPPVATSDQLEREDQQGALPGGVRIELHPVNTAGMVVVTDLAQVDVVDVDGCFVKVVPTLRREERDTVDGAAIIRKLRERGAVAVVFVPHVVSTTARVERVKLRKNQREWVRAYLERNPALSAQDRDAVIALLEPHLSMEGI